MSIKYKRFIHQAPPNRPSVILPSPRTSSPWTKREQLCQRISTERAPEAMDSNQLDMLASKHRIPLWYHQEGIFQSNRWESTKHPSDPWVSLLLFHLEKDENLRRSRRKSWVNGKQEPRAAHLVDRLIHFTHLPGPHGVIPKRKAKDR